MVRRRGRYDVLVIGGGVTGLSAAHHAARWGLSTALIEGELLFGGQIATVERLDGYPAAGELSGIDLAVDLVEGCRSLGVSIIQAPVEALSAEDGGHVAVAGGERHRTRAVVVASGARLKRLDVPGERELIDRGVSQCASCDGPLFRGARTWPSSAAGTRRRRRRSSWPASAARSTSSPAARCGRRRTT